MRVLNEEFEKNKDSSLALVPSLMWMILSYIISLYGIKEGDVCLQRIADDHSQQCG